MHETIKKMAQAFARQREQRRRACAAFTALAILVSLTTTYMLVQPANTMAADYVCGKEAHTHSEECYRLICDYADEAEEDDIFFGEDAELDEELSDAESAEENLEGEDDATSEPSVNEEPVVEPEVKEETKQEEPTTEEEPKVEEPVVAPEVSQPAEEEVQGEPEQREDPATEETPSVTEQPEAPTTQEAPVVEEKVEASVVEEAPAAPAAPVTQETPATPVAASETGTDSGSEAFSGTMSMAMVMYTGGAEAAEVGSEPAAPSELAPESTDTTSAPVETPVEVPVVETPVVEEPVEETEPVEEPTAEAVVDEDPIVEEDPSEETEVTDESADENTPNEDPADENVEEESDVEQEVSSGGSAGGHVHTADCYELICEKEEHVHEESCMSLMMLLPEGAEIPEDYDQEYTYLDPDNRFVVAVYAREEADLEGSVLVAELLEEGSDAHEIAEEALAAKATGTTLVYEKEAEAVEEEVSEEPVIEEIVSDEVPAVEEPTVEEDEIVEETVEAEPSEETQGVEPAQEPEQEELTMEASLLHNTSGPEEAVETEAAELTEEVVAEEEMPAEEPVTENLIVEETSEEEPAEEENEELPYDGFVALDIRFERDGKEVEPKERVYVYINVRGLLPETADPASVEVQHHAETAEKLLGIVPTGNVEVEVVPVANATEETEGIVTVEENTEEAAVDVAAVFDVESFSIFTVTWVEEGLPYFAVKWVDHPASTGGAKELRIYCVDAAGKNLLTKNSTLPEKLAEVPGTHNIKFNTKGNYPLYVDKDNVGSAYCIDYEKEVLKASDLSTSFLSAYIETSAGVKTPAQGISYNPNYGGWLYFVETERTDGSYNGEHIPFADASQDVAEVYFVYNRKMTVIPTEINQNINVDLFDYGSHINNYENGDEKAVLEFMNSLGANARFRFLDGHGINDGRTIDDRPVMKRTLTNGYPEVLYQPSASASFTPPSGSLKYLFDQDLKGGVVIGNSNAVSYDIVSENGTWKTTTITRASTAENTAPVTYETLRKVAVFNPEFGYGTPYERMHLDMVGDGGLFQKDANGYYVYDSGENAAYFNGERFEIYDGLIAPGHVTTQGPLESGNNYKNFMPFDQPGAGYDPNADPNSSTSVNTYKTVGDKTVYVLGHDPNESGNGGAADKRSSIVDTWYGMSVGFDFFQPEGGKAENGDDMVFQFSGDDDVWVYLDGVLVLDIGGTHGRRDGSINFATGEVKFPAHRNTNNPIKTNLRELYTLAYLEKIGILSETDLKVTQDTFDILEVTVEALSEENKTGLNEYLAANGFGADGLTYENYTGHKLNFFYMERGGNIGYCMLKFNMPTLPENALTVEKTEVKAEGISGDSFDFQIELKDRDGNAKTKVDYIDVDGNTKTMTLENGIGTFDLAHGERISFKVTLDDWYKVTELDANKNSYITTVAGKSEGTMTDSVAYTKFTNVYDPDAGSLDTDKTVTGTNQENMWLNLEAYVKGNSRVETSHVPTDVILVLDQSGSMFDAASYDADESARVKVKLNSGKDSHLSFYIQDAMNYTEFNKAAAAVKGTASEYGGAQSRGYYMMVTDTADGAEKSGIWCIKWEASNQKWLKYDIKQRDLATGKVATYCTDEEGTALTANDQKYGVFYKSIFGASCDGLVAFLEELRDTEGVRVAMIGFAGQGVADYEGTGYFLNGSFHNYDGTDFNSHKQSMFEEAWTEEGMNDLYANLSQYQPRYNQTATGIGLRLAQRLVDEVSAKDTTVDREPVIVLFTDGEPTNTASGHTVGTWNGKTYESKEDACTATEQAKRIAKELRTGICYETNTKKHNVVEVFAIAPDSDAIAETTLKALATDASHVFAAAADSFEGVFTVISNTIIDAASIIGTDAILQDVISDNFQLDVDAQKDRVITAKVAAINGTVDSATEHKTGDCAACAFDSETGTFTVTVGTFGADGKFVPDEDQDAPTGDVIQVTGFHYSYHYDGGTDPLKIVVQIPIKPADSDTNPGGYQQNTNDDDDTGIYDEDEKVEEFPEPYADVPTTVKVKKIVKGTTTEQDFSFSATYTHEFDSYKNVELKSVGDSNYLQVLKKANTKPGSASSTLKDAACYKPGEEFWEIEDLMIFKDVNGDGIEDIRGENEADDLFSYITVSEDYASGYHTSIAVKVGDTYLTAGEDYTLVNNGRGVTVPVQPDMVIEFTNTTGPELPSTGGMGTNLFTTLGIVLMLGAGVLLLDQRRRNNFSAG